MVWVTESLLVHVTVVPAATVILAGEKTKFVIATALSVVGVTEVLVVAAEFTFAELVLVADLAQPAPRTSRAASGNINANFFMEDVWLVTINIQSILIPRMGLGYFNCVWY